MEKTNSFPCEKCAAVIDEVVCPYCKWDNSKWINNPNIKENDDLDYESDGSNSNFWISFVKTVLVILLIVLCISALCSGFAIGIALGGFVGFLAGVAATALSIALSTFLIGISMIFINMAEDISDIKELLSYR